MTLVPEAITWQGITIGGGESDVHLDGGIEGFGQPSLNMPSTKRPAGGTWGGLWSPQDSSYTVNAWMDAGAGDLRDWSGYTDLRDSMRNRALPSDEIPLAWSDLMGEGEMCAFVRPSRFEPIADEDGVHGGSPGLDLQWVASDPTVYDYEQTTAALWGSGNPVSSDAFEAANAGALVPWARRAWDVRMTAHGTVSRPWMEVAHDDGTFEKITFEVTLTGGQVLTVADRGFGPCAMVGSRIVSRVTSITEKGITSRAPRWWLLHPSTGDDGNNAVMVGVGSGSVSGYVKTRGTR